MSGIDQHWLDYDTPSRNSSSNNQAHTTGVCSQMPQPMSYLPSAPYPNNNPVPQPARYEQKQYDQWNSTSPQRPQDSSISSQFNTPVPMTVQKSDGRNLGFATQPNHQTNNRTVSHTANTAVSQNAWYEQNQRGQEIPSDRQRKPQRSSSSPQLNSLVRTNVQQSELTCQRSSPSSKSNKISTSISNFFSKSKKGSKPSKQPTKQSHGTVAAIPQSSVSPTEQQLQDELERMRQEDERADREREERIRRRNEERLRKAKEMQELMDTNFRRENEIETVRRNEAKRRMDEEMNSLKNENLNRVRLKEQAYQKELFELKREGDQERRNIEDQREKERMEHEKIIMEKDRKFEEDAMMYEREEHLRKGELVRIQQEHEERKRLIYEEMERKMEEIRRLNEIKMNQMRKQWEQIQKMLQMKVWNVIIENNWTNRLNVLRNSNRNIMDLFKRFYAEASKIQRHCDRSEDVSREIQRIVPVLKTLIGAVEQVESLMTEESEVLYEQWRNTGKGFVYYIKDSVDKVKYTCDKLKNSLKNYEEMLKKKPTFLSSEHEFHLIEIKKNVDDVSMYSNKIPTLAELKRVHSNDMRSETPSNNSSHELVPFQTVIIEEID